MNDDGLIAAKKPDGFTHESPVRAFTEFRVEGRYAIGKGFRPSLSHLTSYLNALEAKEGWQMVQIILPESDAGDPTIVFRKLPEIHVVDFGTGSNAIDVERYFGPKSITTTIDDIKPEHLAAAFTGEPVTHKTPADDLGAPHDEPLLIQVQSSARRPATSSGIYRDGLWFIYVQMQPERVEPLRGVPLAWKRRTHDEWTTHREGDPAALEAKAKATLRPFADAVNPLHYNGRACADIGERLSANGFQTLKYSWRLGRKDDPCIELGKALWYIDSEIALLAVMPRGTIVKPNIAGIVGDPRAFLEERVRDQSNFTQDVAWALWEGYTANSLNAIRGLIVLEKTRLECNPGAAV